MMYGINNMKDDKVIVISDVSQVEENLNKIYKSIELTKAVVFDQLKKLNSIEAFKTIKFDEIAIDPFIHDRHINFIEMLNQSFSDIVVFKGVEYLLKKYKGKTFTLNTGASHGSDIVSDDKSVVAECFFVVSVFNNQKIKKDSEKLMENGKNVNKYIFFYSHRDEKDKLVEYVKGMSDINYLRLKNDLGAFEEL